MRVAVCEAAPELLPGAGDWQALAASVRALAPDLVLLNEMPFGPWLAAAPEPDAQALEASRKLHLAGLALLGDLGARAVLGSRPAEEDGRSVNQAFVWQPGPLLEPVHSKQHFPDEPGYYEARWFSRGTTHFRLAQAAGIRVGFLICTEVMFNEWARHYGRQGAHVIAVPRAVGSSSLRRWRTALSMAAIVSGCYVISSNRGGVDSRGQAFGGCGWIFDPLGDLIAETSPEQPVVSAPLDLELVAQAQREYPCYVAELPGPA